MMKISNIKNTFIRRITLILVAIPALVIYFHNEKTDMLMFDIRQAW